MPKTSKSILVVLGICTVFLAACDFDNAPSGPMQDQPISLDLGKIERANVELNMAAGELNVRGGAAQLLDGHFEYNVPAWKPVIQTSNVGSQETVTIRQPEHVRMGGNHRYTWDLQLNDKVLLDLALHCGAGRARMDLGNLDLRNVDVQMGAGQVELDLRGTPKRDYDVNISGGVGQATIYLPQNVGIRADAHGGLGSITVTGLQKQGDHWENSLYDNAKVNVHLKVSGGIGEIRIIG